MANGALLACRDLSFTYSNGNAPTFRDLSLEVSAGEAAVLMGPSGCGKSTLAYCIAGLYPEYAGELTGQVLVDGQAVTGLSPAPRSRLVSILFQNPDNQFCMSRVDHEILFALENIHYQGDMRARMRELLSIVGLEEVAEHPIHTLSGGTKQKVALATALATEPRLLVLDEPFANVDPEACAELAEHLKRLNRDGMTLLVVDHRLTYWQDFLTRVLLMDKDGTLVDGNIPPADLERRRADFTGRGLFFGAEWLEGRSPAAVKESVPAVLARDLSVSYGKKQVLDGLSLTVTKGSMTALVGRNGSGKSTLLSAVAGLLKHKGTLDVSGPVGLVFQNPRYQFLTLKVRDEVLFTLGQVHGKQAQGLAEEADRLLEEFGLLPFADASPYTLSQGQQRRLAILSMLAGDRPILLLDEPTYAQDERATRFIMELLQRRVAEGLTAVLATHDHGLAAAFCHRVYRLEGGRIQDFQEGGAECGHSIPASNF